MTNPRSSSEIDWHFDLHERFMFMLGSWDVSHAKRIIVATPRPLVEFDISRLVGMASFITDHGGKHGPIDLTIPLIVGTLRVAKGHSRRDEPIIIDGWHRVRLALKSGIGVLPAVQLTFAETREVTR